MPEAVIYELERLNEMNITPQNLQAISLIYDVTLDSGQWGSVLDEVAHQIGGTRGNVFVVSDHKVTGLSSMYVSTHLAPALDVYLERGYNP